MLATHPSHFGLTLLAETSTSAVLSGTLGACKRIAAACGMEVAKYEGYIVSSGPTGLDGSSGAIYTPVSGPDDRWSRILYNPGGMIQRGQDDFTVVIPIELWRAA
jgi:hypothetical protein